MRPTVGNAQVVAVAVKVQVEAGVSGPPGLAELAWARAALLL